jgi:hypothetical protein
MDGGEGGGTLLLRAVAGVAVGWRGSHGGRGMGAGRRQPRRAPTKKWCGGQHGGSQVRSTAAGCRRARSTGGPGPGGSGVGRGWGSAGRARSGSGVAGAAPAGQGRGLACPGRRRPGPRAAARGIEEQLAAAARSAECMAWKRCEREMREKKGRGRVLYPLIFVGPISRRT